MEFELTRHNHLDSATNFTVTALFKMPPKNLVKEAWRVLRGACMQSALLPEIVNQNYKLALRAAGLDEPTDAGFATPPATMPTTTGQPASPQASDAGFATSHATSSKSTGAPLFRA